MPPCGAKGILRVIPYDSTGHSLYTRRRLSLRLYRLYISLSISQSVSVFCLSLISRSQLPGRIYEDPSRQALGHPTIAQKRGTLVIRSRCRSRRRWTGRDTPAVAAQVEIEGKL